MEIKLYALNNLKLIIIRAICCFNAQPAISCVIIKCIVTALYRRGLAILESLVAGFPETHRFINLLIQNRIFKKIDRLRPHVLCFVCY